MNDFEQKLTRQEFRGLPAEWRAAILPTPASIVEEPRASWLDWLWPAPSAWAAVAAVWMIAGALSLWSSDPAGPGSPANADALPPAPTSLYALHAHELRLLLN